MHIKVEQNGETEIPKTKVLVSFAFKIFLIEIFACNSIFTEINNFLILVIKKGFRS